MRNPKAKKLMKMVVEGAKFVQSIWIGMEIGVHAVDAESGQNHTNLS